MYSLKSSLSVKRAARQSATCVGIALSTLATSSAFAQTPSSAPATVEVSRTPELRAFWVDGFNPGFMTPQQCDDLIANLRAMHCNAVFVQMRKRGDAYYASHYEPWAADDPEHFDALAYLCNLAHQPGKPYIQVHAWVNACAVGGSKNPRGVAALHPEWRAISDTGLDFDGESTKIDPGNPGAADWTYRVYMDIVRHYPIDGIHMDFIRYGGDGKTVGHWGYGPVSLARYRAAMGIVDPTVIPAWNDPKWQQWRRDQVTALVRRVYLGAKSIRPDIIVSAATICWGDGPTSDAMYEQKSAAYTDVFADWRGWMRSGILDLNCPMTYVALDKHPTFWQHWSEFVKDHQYGHASVMGVGVWLNSVPNSLQEIQTTRNPGASGRPAAGAVLFSYAETSAAPTAGQPAGPSLYDALKASSVWSADVPVPAMPWRTHPKLGHIAGFALDGPALTPMDQAAVTLRRRIQGGSGENRRRHGRHWRYAPGEWNTTADGNGFYGFANIQPGTYDIRIDWGQRHLVQQGVVVRAGQVAEAPATVTHRSVSGTGKLKDGAQADYVGAVVTSGSDRLGSYFYIADGVGKPDVRVDAPNLVMPTVAGDIVAISGTVAHQGQLPVIDAGQVRFLGAIVPRSR